LDAEHAAHPVRSIGAKVVYVAVGGALWAATLELSDTLRSHSAMAVSTRGPDSLVPVGDLWSVLSNAVLLIFMYCVGGLYRLWYAGRRWAREVFLAVTATCAVGFLLLTAILRTVRHSWTSAALDSETLVVFARLAVVCVTMGAVCTACAIGWRHRQVDRSRTTPGA
jgi:hypothetical protein